MDVLRSPVVLSVKLLTSPKKAISKRIFICFGRFISVNAVAELTIISTDWLGGLLGLFFAIDELNADDDLGDEFKALESTPMLLGFQGEFKDHRQGRDP